jgi:CRP/FNR family transcriptional regulator
MSDSSQIREKVFKWFPMFENASQDVQAELFAHGKIAELPKDHFICLEGNKCSCIPLVLEGLARVYKLSESGREITLYRVEPGQSCIMTASCILSGVEFPAFAATETEVEAIVIPPEILHHWVNKYEIWRDFLCGMLASRLAEVISVVEEVAFQRVDTRTAEYLLQSAGADGAVKKTHLDIATDIGTSREVVSRILKEFEHRGLIRLSRGGIQTKNVNELLRIANPPNSSRGVQAL